ncbi:MAG TPA: hypothetical protein DCY20_04015 [Firmicutes bacterium]|nr:hypothetical protein [Bacillota bacterium]
MQNQKKTYYRNWYAQYQQEDQKRSAERQAQEAYYRSANAVSNVDPTQYKANHDYRASYSPQQSRQSPRQAPKGSYEQRGYKPSSRESTMELSLNESMGSDMLRGLLVGLPLLIGVFVIMYAMGILPEINAEPSYAAYPELVTYADQYETLMSTYNSVNQSIRERINTQDFSSFFKSELGKQQVTLQTATTTLTTQTDTRYQELNRLLGLKLTSLNNMVTAFVAAEEVTPELSQAYEEFMRDQNELATQITQALTTLLTDYDVNYEKVVGGIQLN